MTFDDWFYDQFDRTREAAEAAWDYQQQRIDELIAKLKLIEDAIAFELGGEPCGLHEAHDLVKAMIQAAQEGE